MPTKVLIFILAFFCGCSQNNLGVKVSELFERLDETEAKLNKAEAELSEAREQLQEEKNKSASLDEMYKKAKGRVVQLERESAEKTDLMESIKSELQALKEVSRQKNTVQKNMVELPDSVFGLWEFQTKDFIADSDTFRVGIIKPVGQKKVAFDEAIIRLQQSGVLGAYGDVAAIGKALGVKEFNGEENIIKFQATEGSDRGTVFSMEFMQGNAGLIWSDHEHWPRDEFDQPKQIEFRKWIEKEEAFDESDIYGIYGATTPFHFFKISFSYPQEVPIKSLSDIQVQIQIKRKESKPQSKQVAIEWDGLTFTKGGWLDKESTNKWQVRGVADGILNCECIEGLDVGVRLEMDFRKSQLSFDHPDWHYGKIDFSKISN